MHKNKLYDYWLNCKLLQCYVLFYSYDYSNKFLIDISKKPFDFFENDLL